MCLDLGAALCRQTSLDIIPDHACDYRIFKWLSQDKVEAQETPGLYASLKHVLAPAYIQNHAANKISKTDPSPLLPVPVYSLLYLIVRTTIVMSRCCVESLAPETTIRRTAE
jgi:hypothetical protein